MRFRKSLVTGIFPVLLFANCNGLPTPEPRANTIQGDRSWFASDIGSEQRLIFVTDRGTDDVDIYSLPTLKREGRISGFTLPAGECSDAFGNVWVANVGAYEVRQYSHTGMLLSSVTESYGFPSYCAVNQADDALAVSNLQDVNDKPGQVVVYKEGTRAPRLRSNPQQYYYDADAYDPQGNLFVIGRRTSREVILSECPIASTCRTVRISGATIYFPSILQWYRPGNELVIGDAECGNVFASCLYRFSISGSTATFVGKTTLQDPAGGPACIVYDPVIVEVAGKAIVIGASDTKDTIGCELDPPNLAVWPFPAGGRPAGYNSTGLSQPFGVAVSAR